MTSLEATYKGFIDEKPFLIFVRSTVANFADQHARDSKMRIDVSLHNKKGKMSRL